jgi:hypothetical protein
MNLPVLQQRLVDAVPEARSYLVSTRVVIFPQGAPQFPTDFVPVLQQRLVWELLRFQLVWCQPGLSSCAPLDSQQMISFLFLKKGLFDAVSGGSPAWKTTTRWTLYASHVVNQVIRVAPQCAPLNRVPPVVALLNKFARTPLSFQLSSASFGGLGRISIHLGDDNVIDIPQQHGRKRLLEAVRN